MVQLHQPSRRRRLAEPAAADRERPVGPLGRSVHDLQETRQALLDAPDGLETTLSLFEVAQVRPPDRYVLRRSSLTFTVRGDPTGLVPGQEWTVHGVFEDGELVEHWRVDAPARPRKKALGLLGLGIAAVLGLGAVRVTAAGLMLRG